MSLNLHFHKGTNRNQLQNAMNPFQYLVPARKISDECKNELDRPLSVSHPLEQTQLGNEYRLEYQTVSAAQPSFGEWVVPSQD